MITMDLREAIQLQSVYGPGTGAYALVADLGRARDSVLAFLTAPIVCGWQPCERPSVVKVWNPPSGRRWNFACAYHAPTCALQGSHWHVRAEQ